MRLATTRYINPKQPSVGKCVPTIPKKKSLHPRWTLYQSDTIGYIGSASREQLPQLLSDSFGIQCLPENETCHYDHKLEGAIEVWIMNHMSSMTPDVEKQHWDNLNKIRYLLNFRSKRESKKSLRRYTPLLLSNLTSERYNRFLYRLRVFLTDDEYQSCFETLKQTVQWFRYNGASIPLNLKDTVSDIPLLPSIPYRIFPALRIQYPEIHFALRLMLEKGLTIKKISRMKLDQFQVRSNQAEVVNIGTMIISHSLVKDLTTVRIHNTDPSKPFTKSATTVRRRLQEILSVYNATGFSLRKCREYGFKKIDQSRTYKYMRGNKDRQHLWAEQIDWEQDGDGFLQMVDNLLEEVPDSSIHIQK